MSFGEFVPGSEGAFEVPGFTTQDVPLAESDVVEEPVKEEGV